MVYKRYYSPFEEQRFPSSSPPRESVKEIADCQQETVSECAKPARSCSQKSPFSLLQNMQLDDLLLIGVLILLITEEQENRDMPLILTLGFLLLIGYIERD